MYASMNVLHARVLYWLGSFPLFDNFFQRHFPNKFDVHQHGTCAHYDGPGPGHMFASLRYFSLIARCGPRIVQAPHNGWTGTAFEYKMSLLLCIFVQCAPMLSNSICSTVLFCFVCLFIWIWVYVYRSFNWERFHFWSVLHIFYYYFPWI